MRRLHAALAACVLAAAPAALAAQQTQTTQTTNAHSHPAHPHPMPSGGSAYHKHGNHGYRVNPNAGVYPLVVNGSVIDRLLATPSPKPKHTPAAKTKYGEQVFETHSTDDAR